MTLSLRLRLFLAFLLVLAVALAMVTAIAAGELRHWAIDRQGEMLERAARAALVVLDARGDGADREALVQALAHAQGARVTLIDSLGVVGTDSEVPHARLGALENHAQRAEVAAALAGRVGRDVRHSRSVGIDYLYVAIPARAVPGVAVLRVAEPLSDIARSGATLMRALWLASLASFALTALLLFWMVGRTSARIEALEQIARRLGAGDHAARARELPGDEVGRLGAAINRMAGELRDRLSALERERDQRELVLSRMSDGVALLDASGRVLHANRNLAAVLGASLPPVAGSRFLDAVRLPDLEDVLASARRSGQTVERDLRLWTPEERPVRATATPLDGGEAGTLLLVLRDLSEVERLDRVRRDFVANVSHEIKTPLTSVRGYAETLLEGGLDDAEHREGFVRIIRDQAQRLQELVDDLLSLAELERPEARLRLERFDLRALLERQIAGLADRALASGLSLSLAAGGPEWVEADRARIEQVAANLLDNALKYTERGAVTVALGGDVSHAWCEVRDTGPGIPAEDLSRIFERFYRVDKARSREKGGTGLGLSIVKHIVGLHDGRVTVAAVPGGGTTFRFELPRHAESGTS